MVNNQMGEGISPPQEIESMDTDQDVPVGVDFEKVSI